MTTRVTFAPQPTGSDAPDPIDDNGAVADRPAWLPENMADGEALAKSYKELQAELTRVKQGKGLPSGDAAKGTQQAPAQAAANGNSIPDSADAEGDAENDAAKKAVEAAGLDVSSYQTEFESTGDVSPENRAKIAEGLKAILGENARTVVDQYIDGRKTTVVNDAAMIRNAAGGDEAYSTMVTWASTALKPEEVASYNRTVNSGDRHAALLAVEGLRRRFESINGKEPALFKGGSVPNGGGLTAYRSAAEWKADMKSDKYKTDAHFREQVKARLAISDI